MGSCNRSRDFHSSWKPFLPVGKTKPSSKAGDEAFCLPLSFLVDGPGVGAWSESATLGALGQLGRGRRPDEMLESDAGAKQLDSVVAVDASEPEHWLGGT